MGQIQRIQSIYLLIAALITSALFLFPFATAEVQVQGYFQDGSLDYQDHLGLMILCGVVLGLSVLPVFVYNNRNLQINMLRANVLTCVGLAALLLYFVSQIPHQYQLGISLFIPIVVVFVLALAIRAIGQDEKLVRDSDRLR